MGPRRSSSRLRAGLPVDSHQRLLRHRGRTTPAGVQTQDEWGVTYIRTAGRSWPKSIRRSSRVPIGSGIRCRGWLPHMRSCSARALRPIRTTWFVAGLLGPFTMMYWYLMDLATLSISVYDDPELVDVMCDAYTQWALGVAADAVALGGVDAFSISDDWGGTQALLMSPATALVLPAAVPGPGPRAQAPGRARDHAQRRPHLDHVGRAGRYGHRRLHLHRAGRDLPRRRRACAGGPGRCMPAAFRTKKPRCSPFKAVDISSPNRSLDPRRHALRKHHRLHGGSGHEHGRYFDNTGIRRTCRVDERQRVTVPFSAAAAADRVPWLGDLDYWATALVGRGLKLPGLPAQPRLYRLASRSWLGLLLARIFSLPGHRREL